MVGEEKCQELFLVGVIKMGRSPLKTTFLLYFISDGTLVSLVNC